MTKERFDIHQHITDKIVSSIERGAGDFRNFNRAETDMYFGKRVKGGGIGNLSHSRELYLTDSPVVRPNRDTLYSGAVFDYDAGQVTITLPDAGNRFMSMQVIDEDQYTHCPRPFRGAGGGRRRRRIGGRG